MTVAEAERQAEKLMREALETGRWFHVPEELAKLRAVIQRGDDRQKALL